MAIIERCLTSTKELPDGWRWARLGDICVVNPRRSTGLIRCADAPTSFVPMQAVDDKSGTIDRAEFRPFAAVKKGYTYFEEGDVIFAKITPCMQNGKHAVAKNLIEGFGFGSTEFHVLRPNQEILPEWVHRYLRQPTVLARAKAYLTGAVGQQRVPDSFLANLVIPLPPISEQQRIMNVVEEQLLNIEKAKAAAEAQLEAAKALPASYLRAVFESPEAQGWPRIKLGEVIARTQNGLYKPESFYGSGCRILKMFNIGRLDGAWGLERVDLIQLTTDELQAYALNTGDILLNRVNSRELVAKCAVVNEKIKGAVFESKNMRIAVDCSKTLPEYVAIWLNSRYGRNQIEQRIRQIVGMATVNKSDLFSIEMSLPQLADQKRIVESYAGKTSVIEKMQSFLNGQIDLINKLPSALLRQAFEGAL